MKGYFSLVQYCPDVARREAANVGVILLCPEIGFLEIKMAPNNQRVQKFFGKEADHYFRLDQMKAALRERLNIERERLLSFEALTGFINTWANKVAATPLRPIKVLLPADDLLALFHELVEQPASDLSVKAAIPLRKRLDSTLGAAALAPLVRKKVTVEVPAFKSSLTAPYGYQNGRFNLVVPHEFTQEGDAWIEKAACKLAVEGNSLYQHENAKLGALQLIVVAEFAPGHDKAREMVHDVFNEYHVRLFEAEKLPELESEIKAHAKPLKFY